MRSSCAFISRKRVDMICKCYLRACALFNVVKVNYCCVRLSLFFCLFLEARAQARLGFISSINIKSQSECKFLVVTYFESNRVRWLESAILVFRVVLGIFPKVIQKSLLYFPYVVE